MSLRGRLVVAVALVALVALVAADLATYSALGSFLESRTDQVLQQATGAILQARGPQGGPLAPAPPAGTPLPTSGTALPARALAGRAPGLFVELRGPGGDVVQGPFPSRQQDGTDQSPVLPAQITGFTPRGTGRPDQSLFSAPSAGQSGPEFRVLATKQHNGDVLVVASPVSDTASTLHRLLVIELVVTGAALVVALALGWWLVRVGLRPLADVEDTAERIAEGDLDQRVPGENGRTEVGRLARTLNVMLGRIQGAFVARDATEAELRRSEDRLRRFVADASHELRTPLAAVAAYAELFERGARDRPADLDRVMSGIRSETGRMGHLVDDLLLLARLDQGRPLARTPVDLTDVARGAVATAMAVGPAWPVTLQATGPAVVVGDPDRLRQVLDNLLANIRSHTPPGTRATVGVAGAPGGAVVEVADTGPGIAAADRARLFERFYRADPARARDHGGTGLGLAIVAAIVGAHGGQVAAADRPGGGTVFTITLPAEPPAEGTAHADPYADPYAVPYADPYAVPPPVAGGGEFR